METMNKDIEKEAKSDKRHVCQTCGSSFNRPYRLTQHLLLHQNIKIFQCGEEGCDKSYTSKSHLDRHLFSVHIKPDFGVVHRCPECMKTFSNRQNLKRHMKIKHDSKTAFKCDVCRADFKKKHLLSSHMYYHTLVKPFSCELCSKEFISLLEKKKHMKNHKTYNCEQCNMAFDRWSKYQKHRKSEHDIKDYNCNDCGRKFKQREHMVRHVKTHILAKPVLKKFTCWYGDCERVYSRHSNLKQHVEMKHLQLTHTCEICDAQLSSKTTLKKHLKTHCKPEDLCLKHISVRKHPKTKETGRKHRKDKGTFRNSTALRIAGLFDLDNEETIIEVVNEPTHNGIKLDSRAKEEFKMLPKKVPEKNPPKNLNHHIGTTPNTIINISLEQIHEMETTNLTTDAKIGDAGTESRNSGVPIMAATEDNGSLLQVVEPLS